LPAAGIADGDRAGLVHAIELDVERAALALRRHADGDVVDTVLRNIHGVLEPLAVLRPADVVASVDVARGRDIDRGRAEGVGALLRGVRVVERDALAAFVKGLGVDPLADGERRAEDRRLRRAAGERRRRRLVAGGRFAADVKGDDAIEVR